MARTFGGVSTDEVTFSTYAAMNGLTAMTFSAWVYRLGDSASGNGRILDKLNGATSGWQVYEDVSGNFYDIANSQYATAGTWEMARPTANAWHHLGIVYDGSAAANVPVMYSDGVSQTVTTFTQSAGAFTADSAAICIGNRSSDQLRVFNGKICEIAVWNVLLTATEIKALALGVSPLRIRPANRVFFPPVYGVQSPEPNFAISGSTGTVTGTVRANHAPVERLTQRRRLGGYLVVPVSQTTGIPIESLKGLSPTASLPIESLQSMLQTGSVPVEALQGLLQAAGIPVEELGAVAGSGAIPIEALSTTTQTSGVPIELLQGASQTTGIPIEVLQGLFQTAGIPIENVQGLLVTATVPIEALGLTSVSQTATVPIEVLGTIVQSSGIPAELLQGLVQVGAVPTELLASVAITGQMAIEVLASILTTSTLPIEALQYLSQAVQIPIECLLNPNALVITDTLTATAGFSQTLTKTCAMAQTANQTAPMAQTLNLTASF